MMTVEFLALRKMARLYSSQKSCHSGAFWLARLMLSLPIRDWAGRDALNGISRKGVSPMTQSQVHILVVDDERNIRNNLSMVLESGRL